MKQSIFLNSIIGILFTFPTTFALGQTSAIDLFTEIQNQFPASTYNSHRSRVVFSATEKELHLSHEPNPAQVNSLPSPSNHVILGTINKLIDRVPKNENIRLAFFNLAEESTANAIIRAIDRGVHVRIVLSNKQHIHDEPGIDDSSSSDLSVAEVIRDRILSAMTLKGITNNSFVVCLRGEGAGSCDVAGQQSKNHNKFLTLSKLCKLGVDAITGNCVNDQNYTNLFVQTSLNFSPKQRTKFNTLSLFYDNEPLFLALRNYHSQLQYRNQQLYSNSVQNDPVLGPHATSNNSYSVSMLNGSPITVNTLPITQTQVQRDAMKAAALNPSSMNESTMNADVMIRSLFSTNYSTNCPTIINANGETIRTKIRISNAHWTMATDSNNLTRGNYMIAALKELQKRGCDVKILGSRELTPYGENNDAFYALYSAGLNVRSYSQSTDQATSNHTKFITLVEPDSGSKIGLKIVMFGSMSITQTAHDVNDETWFVWKNPSKSSLKMYTESFDQIFRDLSVFENEFKIVDLFCQRTGSNSSCAKTAVCPNQAKVFSAKAACNLEYGGVTTDVVNSLLPNVLKVNRASDNVNEGHCSLGSSSISAGQAKIIPNLNSTSLNYSCSEHDSNGADCVIKGQLTCYQYPTQN